MALNVVLPNSPTTRITSVVHNISLVRTSELRKSEEESFDEPLYGRKCCIAGRRKPRWTH